MLALGCYITEVWRVAMNQWVSDSPSFDILNHYETELYSC